MLKKQNKRFDENPQMRTTDKRRTKRALSAVISVLLLLSVSGVFPAVLSATVNDTARSVREIESLNTQPATATDVYKTHVAGLAVCHMRADKARALLDK